MIRATSRPGRNYSKILSASCRISVPSCDRNPSASRATLRSQVAPPGFRNYLPASNWPPPCDPPG